MKTQKEIVDDERATWNNNSNKKWYSEKEYNDLRDRFDKVLIEILKKIEGLDHEINKK